jgi:Tfp pilus assembly protein PilN
MPNINLIQEQKSARRRSEAVSRAGFFGFVGITLLSGLAWGGVRLQVDQQRSLEAKLQAQLIQLRPALDEIAQNDKLVAELSPRVESLEAAQEMSSRWVRILTHFTTQTPTDAWLTGLRASSPDPTQPVNVVLVGMAKGQEPVGEFMMRTQNESSLDGVALRYTQEKVTNQGPVIEFELGAVVKDASTEKITEENKS